MILAALAATAIASAASPGERYGDSLLRWEVGRHPQIRSASIEIDGSPRSQFRSGAAARGATLVSVPLLDGLSNRIGTVTLGLTGRRERPRAAKIASELSRHIYSQAVLTEPDPFVAGAFRSKAGQRLVERELAAEPDLVTIAFHVALPGRSNEIIASNFGRIGKAADADDQHVIKDSAVLQEETNGGRRAAVELPLLDRSGHVIGALSTSFLVGRGGKPGAYRSALRVQHALSHAIADLDALAR